MICIHPTAAHYNLHWWCFSSTNNAFTNVHTYKWALVLQFALCGGGSGGNYLHYITILWYFATCTVSTYRHDRCTSRNCGDCSGSPQLVSGIQPLHATVVPVEPTSDSSTAGWNSSSATAVPEVDVTSQFKRGSGYMEPSLSIDIYGLSVVWVRLSNELRFELGVSMVWAQKFCISMCWVTAKVDWVQWWAFTMVNWL